MLKAQACPKEPVQLGVSYETDDVGHLLHLLAQTTACIEHVPESSRQAACLGLADPDSTPLSLDEQPHAPGVGIVSCRLGTRRVLLTKGVLDDEMCIRAR